MSPAFTTTFATVAIAAFLGAAWLSLSGCQDLLGVDVVVPESDDQGGTPDAGVEPGADAGVAADAGVVDPCSGDIAQEDAWNCLIETACDVVTGCTGEALSREECERAELELYGIDMQAGQAVTDDAIARGAMTYDGTGVSACLDQLRQFQCFEFESESDPFDDCLGLIGQVPAGGTCFFDRECAPLGSRCEQFSECEEACCVGTCLAPAGLGESCEEEFLCELGAHCVEGTCQDGEEGARCDSSRDCDEAFWCDDGTCSPDEASGAKFCIEDAACPRPENCIGLRLPKAFAGICGESIKEGDRCDGVCASNINLFCERDSIDELGTCKPRGLIGESCDLDLPDSCAVKLRCGGKGTCEPIARLGDECFGGENCGARFGEVFCSADITFDKLGVCMVRQANGAECSSSRHCESGVCEKGRCSAFPGCRAVDPAALAPLLAR